MTKHHALNCLMHTFSSLLDLRIIKCVRYSANT
jgi:hypothetical protein